MRFILETSSDTSRWILNSYYGEYMTGGNEFNKFSDALKDLQKFAIETEKAPIFFKSEILSGVFPNASYSYPLKFVISKKHKSWFWNLYIGDKEIFSSISLINPNRRLETANSALRSAMRFRIEMAFAPIYDEYDMLINATRFSKAFAFTRAIADPNPSGSKLFS